MGKSSQKRTTKVEAALTATTIPLKKGKRDAEDHLDNQVNPKKQKKDLISALHTAKADEELAPVKKQPTEKAKVESSLSEDESSSDEETAHALRQPVAKDDEKLSASSKGKSDSSEEDYDDEESDDEKPPQKQAIASSTKTSKQESTSDESDDEEESEEEKDSDSEMVEAEQKSNAKDVKSPREPKTPTTHSQGGVKTLFVGNLSFKVESSDVENLFKKAGKVVDVRLATNEDGSSKGFAHVEFASAEAAQNALKLSGKPLLGRDVRASLAKDKDRTTAQSSNSGSQQRSQSKTIFVNGFDASLGEKEIKSALRDHFKTCGEVTRIVLPADRETGALRGMAFIDFKDGIDKALELSGSEVKGRRIRVGEGRQRGEDSTSIGDFSKRGRGRENNDRFSKRGRGRDSRGRGRGRDGPVKPSVVNSAQGKKIVFDDE